MNFERTNTKIPLLDDYYEHFDEDHRLETRHGNIEYVTSMKYIHEVIGERKQLKILDVGCATGKYSIPLFNEGHNVIGVELVKHNIEVFKKKNQEIPVYEGNAMDLSSFNDESFDLVLLFGPMYHLLKLEERIKALNEAKRVTKKDGVIMVAYVMNEYAILTYGFIKNKIKESIEEGRVNDKYQVLNKKDDLYSYLRIEDINYLNEVCGLKRIKIIASDGPSDYLRRELNQMDEETYQEFIKYHLSICERDDLIGASAHTLDILKR